MLWCLLISSFFSGQAKFFVYACLPAVQARHGSIEQRLGYLEKEMGDSFDEHAKQLDEVKKAWLSEDVGD